MGSTLVFASVSHGSALHICQCLEKSQNEFPFRATRQFLGRTGLGRLGLTHVINNGSNQCPLGACCTTEAQHTYRSCFWARNSRDRVEVPTCFSLRNLLGHEIFSKPKFPKIAFRHEIIPIFKFQEPPSQPGLQKTLRPGHLFTAIRAASKASEVNCWSSSHTKWAAAGNSSQGIFFFPQPKSKTCS